MYLNTNLKKKIDAFGADFSIFTHLHIWKKNGLRPITYLKKLPSANYPELYIFSRISTNLIKLLCVRPFTQHLLNEKI